MFKKLLIILSVCAWMSSASAMERIYVGGMLGQVDLHGNAGQRFSDALGFGGEVGVAANPLMDIILRLSSSSHSGGTNGMSLLVPTISADYGVFDANDFRLSLGGGPGLYIFNPGSSVVRFGLHAEAFADVMVENIRIGIGYRFHGVFDPGANEGNLSQILMRVGYTFGE